MKHIFTVFLILIFCTPLFSQFNAIYFNYETVIQNFNQLNQSHSQLISNQIIGTTETLSKPIYAYKIANNTQFQKYNLLVIGGIYGRDIHTVQALYSWLSNELGEGNIDQFTNQLDKVNIWVIPTLNPEGYYISHLLENFNILGNYKDLNNDGFYYPLLDGVNINRNFAFNWIHGDPFNQVNNQYFQGVSSQSEFETQAITTFINANPIDFCINLSTEHSTNEIIFPYNWFSLRQSPDYQELESISTSIRSGFSNSTSWNVLGNTERVGNIIDDLYIMKGVPCLTVSFGEINFPDLNQLNNIEDCLQVTLEKMIIGYSNGYFNQNDNLGLLHLKARNQITQENVEASIIIEGKHSDAFKGNKPHGSDGFYNRFLISGNYTVTINAKGYQTIIEDIVINSHQINTLIFDMIPLNPVIVTGTITSEDSFYENKMIIRSNGYEQEVQVENDQYTFSAFEGDYEITVYSENTSPIIKYFSFTQPVNHVDFHLTYSNSIFTEEFDGSCCSWSINGPWQVVSDSTHNSQFMTDSWSGNGFYEVNADYKLMMSFPINLFGLSEQDAFLIFDYYVYSEWDNDYFTVELSYDGSEWFSVFKYSGEMDSWKRAFINLNQYREHDLWLRFRIKDGFLNNPNHEGLTDPGVKIDHIQIINGISNSSTTNVTVPRFFTELNSIYPNPIKDQSTLVFSLKRPSKISKVQIFNIKGQLLSESVLRESEVKNGKTILKTNHLSSGIYLIRIKNDREISNTKKAIIIK